ncbi:hypothetical protein V5N11_006007 [Cardamine amara subsp. amara]|uniref:Uncharacterized protein n=1 Tax=Cardamine amara subsp. amara TaxID=228776 RepID=A0ABD1BT95_CARAN
MEPKETRNRIFFTCPYSAGVWKSLTQKLLGSKFTTQWDTLLDLLVDTSQEKVRLFILRYVFQITIHSIWRERNGRRHGEPETHHTYLTKIIDKQVRNRLSTIRAMGDWSLDKGMEMWFNTR